MSAAGGAFEPSEAQRAIIEAEAREIVVVAGAGSGKTATLTRRYLRLVEAGARPRGILCITYTKKAAAEMKGRIVGALAAAGLPDAAQEAETGPIATVHSLCERILRENALVAGIDPEFGILDEADRASLWRESILDAAAEEPPDAREAEAHRRLLDALIGAVDAWGYANGKTSSSKAEEVVGELVEAWRNRGYTPESVRAELVADEGAWHRRTEAWLRDALPDDLRASLAEAPSGTLADDLREHRRVFARGPMPEWAKGLLSASELRLDEYALSMALAELAVSSWERYLATLARRNELDFGLLESRAVALVEEEPRVSERLRRQYPHVMVDESQDMNPVQNRLLAAIAPASALFVGDGQQSIFRFRGADRDLFLARSRSEREVFPLATNYRSKPQILDYVEAVFTRLWGEDYLRMTPPRQDVLPTPPFGLADPGDPDFDPFAPAPAPPAIPTGDEPGEIRLVQGAMRETVAAVRYYLDRGLSPGDIAVLSPTKPALVANALTSAGIPNRVIGGNERFYTRLETRDLANVLGAIAAPEDRLALLATLRSPAVGLSLGGVLLFADKPRELPMEVFEPELEDDRAKYARFLGWYRRLVHLADHLPAWEILGRVLAESDLLANLAREPNRDQAIANVRKMLALATARPEVSLAEFARLVRDVRRVDVREGEAALAEEDEPLVSVTTVHRAKGLEWDVVVYHEAGRKPRRDTATVTLGPSGALFALKLDGGKGSPLFQAMREVNRAAEEEEAQRLDYVAATRARRVFAVVTGTGNGANRLPAMMRKIPAHLWSPLDLKPRPAEPDL